MAAQAWVVWAQNKLWVENGPKTDRICQTSRSYLKMGRLKLKVVVYVEIGWFVSSLKMGRLCKNKGLENDQSCTHNSHLVILRVGQLPCQ